PLLAFADQGLKDVEFCYLTRTRALQPVKVCQEIASQACDVDWLGHQKPEGGGDVTTCLIQWTRWSMSLAGAMGAFQLQYHVRVPIVFGWRVISSAMSGWPCGSLTLIFLGRSMIVTVRPAFTQAVVRASKRLAASVCVTVEDLVIFCSRCSVLIPEDGG